MTSGSSSPPVSLPATPWWLPDRYADCSDEWKAGYRLGLEGRPPSDSGFTRDALIAANAGVRQAWEDMEADNETDWAAQAKRLESEDADRLGISTQQLAEGLRGAEAGKEAASG